MTLALNDVKILLGLPIDGHAFTSTGVYNRIMLYEHAFRLAPLFLN